MVYGAEAVLPPEIGLHSLRVEKFNPTTNETDFRVELEWLDKACLLVERQASEVARLATRHFNSRVQPWAFHVGELVLRRHIFSAQADKNKLSPSREGTYHIKEIQGGLATC